MSKFIAKLKAYFILTFKKKKLIAQLTPLFENDAKKFNGLYKGIYQLSVDKNIKKIMAIDEFNTRLSNLSGYDELIDSLSPFFPAKEKSPKLIIKLSGIILEATKEANIYHTKKDDVIKLTNENASDYQEWEGEEIYEDDTVKIVLPAWYQGKRLIEHGYCVLKNN